MHMRYSLCSQWNRRDLLAGSKVSNVIPSERKTIDVRSTLKHRCITVRTLQQCIVGEELEN